MINFFVLRIIGIWYNFCGLVWGIICTFVLKNLMPATLTRPKTASKKTTTSQELKKEATKNKTATTQTALSSKKKKTIEELAERAQSIISKYDIEPFDRNTLYGNL